jgi:ABC-type nitrate/sulfonate/bicarbonate transport system permease component
VLCSALCVTADVCLPARSPHNTYLLRPLLYPFLLFSILLLLLTLRHIPKYLLPNMSVVSTGALVACLTNSELWNDKGKRAYEAVLGEYLPFKITSPYTID